MLIVTGKISVSPTDLPTFLADLQALAVSAREREGNRSYDVAVIDASHGLLLIAERWESPDALGTHLGAEETATFVERWGDRMKVDIRKYDAANERTVTDE
jgi:quinol monooxygenase YgiN